MFIVMQQRGHTGKLQGVCKFTYLAFQANVFDIEQWQAVPGFGLSDWNATEKESPGVIQMLTSPQLLRCFKIPFKFSDDQYSPTL